MREKTQRETLEAIKKFQNKNGYPPTIRELCVVLGKTSPATVKTRIDKLKQLGKITYEPGKFRTIKIIEE